MHNNRIVIATDLAGGMGINNTLPWPHNKKDLLKFKQLTEGQALLMGGATFRSMQKAGVVWGSRIPYVLTRDVSSIKPPAIGVGPADMEELLNGEEPITAIGGATLLNVQELWDTVEEVHVTTFCSVYKCDTFLHRQAMFIMQSVFEVVERETIDENVTYSKRIRIKNGTN